MIPLTIKRNNKIITITKKEILNWLNMFTLFIPMCELRELIKKEYKEKDEI